MNNVGYEQGWRSESALGLLLLYEHYLLPASKHHAMAAHPIPSLTMLLVLGPWIDISIGTADQTATAKS